MITPDLQALIELSEKATPGPWGWRNRHGQIEIAAPHGGGTVVMGFVRDGMRNAQPVFGVSLDGLPRGKRGGILRSAKDLIADDPDGELSHPDAQFMVAAANYVRNLLTAPTLPGAGGGEFEGGYVKGYRAALGAASAECRRIGTAIDGGGNTYVRYEDAIKCSVSVSALHTPEIKPHSVEDCYQHFLAYSGLQDSETLKYAYFHGANVGVDRPQEVIDAALPPQQGG